jgi:hypothetical protein
VRLGNDNVHFPGIDALTSVFPEFKMARLVTSHVIMKPMRKQISLMLLGL